MIKTVLRTTTRAGWIYVAAGLASSHTETTASVAVVPNLTIHGNSIVNTYFVNQKNRENGRGEPQPHIAVDVSNLYFTILGCSSNGL